MTPPTFLLANRDKKAQAIRWIERAPWKTVVTFKLPKRTLPQNNLLHLLCTDVAKQVSWHGKKRSVEAWKDIFTAALLSSRNELDVVPGINGGFVLLGMHTSDLNKQGCADLIELIYAFGAERGVRFSTDDELPREDVV